jgi:co-chaperonin GroES (HSP10)
MISNANPQSNKPITIENTQFNHNFDLEDWDIDALFKDTIWGEFIDELKGEKTTRAGLIVPEHAQSVKEFYRIARVLKVGPECSDCVVEGSYVLVPPQLGLKGLKSGPNGGPTIFLKESNIMAVISPKTEEVVTEKIEKV